MKEDNISADEITAKKIANLYLSRYPRKQYYELTRDSLDGMMTYNIYVQLDSKSLAIIKHCSLADAPIETRLRQTGHSDIADLLTKNENNIPMAQVLTVDTEHTFMITNFEYQVLEDNGQLSEKKGAGIDLTNEEFTELLIELILYSNQYSFNTLVCNKPEMAQMIMQNIVNISSDNVYENYRPIICYLKEINDIVDSILNPFIDKLGLFHSIDDEIREFVYIHQIVPEENAIYTEEREDRQEFFRLLYEGTTIQFDHNIFDKGFKSDKFKIDARELMSKFNLKQPSEIYPFLKLNYSSPDGYSRLKNDMKEKIHQ